MNGMLNTCDAVHERVNGFPRANQQAGPYRDLTGRLEAFPLRPVAGAGIGAYGAAVDPVLGATMASHDGCRAILVKLGLIAFLMFSGLIMLAVIPVIMVTRAGERWFFVFLAGAMMVALVPVNVEFHKATSIVLGLFTARSAPVVDAYPSNQALGSVIGHHVDGIPR